MTETDALAARLVALETVLGHLMTHLAVRADDPPSWVATRRALALRAVHDHPPLDEQSRACVSQMEEAVSGFFDDVEGVIGAYGGDCDATPATVVR